MAARTDRWRGCHRGRSVETVLPGEEHGEEDAERDRGHRLTPPKVIKDKVIEDRLPPLGEIVDKVSG
jgi:hypothetical protein